jgi:hypothetical protein
MSLLGGILIIGGIVLAFVVLGFLGHVFVDRMNLRARTRRPRGETHPPGQVGQIHGTRAEADRRPERSTFEPKR